MACSHRNLIVNGDFRARLAPWTGTQIRRVRNPENKNDFSVAMGTPNGKKQSVLSQRIKAKLEPGCAYYLTFRIINDSPDHISARFYATVAYLNSKGKLIRSTPLFLIPPELPRKKYRSYFSIVPPPPKNASQLKVVFWLQQGFVYIDTIRLGSHEV